MLSIGQPPSLRKTDLVLNMDENLQKELIWASGTLVAFLILLVYGGTSEPTEIAIAVGAFAASWAMISYSINILILRLQELGLGEEAVHEALTAKSFSSHGNVSRQTPFASPDQRGVRGGGGAPRGPRTKISFIVRGGGGAFLALGRRYHYRFSRVFGLHKTS